MGSPRICEVGGSDKGLLLPAFGDTEAAWPDWMQAILYLLGLLWCFMGVAIISDVFMGAIEQITSKKVRRYNPTLDKEVTLLVWNGTVANLTLMALGSSAPEILLNVKEVFENSFYAGTLGPSTIVGSAAYNLLCIIAVCVSSIPAGETRAIRDLGVYGVTATFSIFAYLWLLLILVGPTPNRVDVAEGVLTFAFFPVLVVTAFLADVGRLPGLRKPPKDNAVQAGLDQKEFQAMEMMIREKYGSDLTPQQVAALIDFENSEGPRYSRAFHRVNATREMFRGKTLTRDQQYEAGRRMFFLARQGRAPVGPTVSFESDHYIVLESQGSVAIKVHRNGDTSRAVKVSYQTRDGSAKEGSDYHGGRGDLNFAPGEILQAFAISIEASAENEETEDFFVDLSIADEDRGDPPVGLGKHASTRVRIIDENHPGKLAFESESRTVEDSPAEPTSIGVTVRRNRGHDGRISCSFRTENDTAYAGQEYVAAQGLLEFEAKETSKTFDVTILPFNTKFGARHAFRVILEEPTGGATFDETTDGGKESAILTVFLGSRRKSTNGICRLDQAQLQIGHAKWKDQFQSAIHCRGDAAEEDDATLMDWTIHIIAMPWKLFFALVPPVEYCGGWLCFCVALGVIGFVTVLIGDIAEMLGCALHISSFATAITFVALGTSLPDTFASMSAAAHDGCADACIGNVTGSNSVNVFLGLGLPWMIASIYWAAVGAEPGDEWSLTYPSEAIRYPGGGFIVKSGSLGLSVAVFSGCSVACIIILAVRRRVLGAELGGPALSKYATSAVLFLLWVVTVVVSIALDDTE